MAKSGVKVEILYNKFPDIAKKIPKAAAKYDKETLEYGQDLIIGAMWESTPGPSSPGSAPAIDTGALMDSIKIEMESEQEGSLYTNNEYAAYMEYGTSTVAPRPFMTPASERMRRKMNDLFSKLEKDLE